MRGISGVALLFVVALVALAAGGGRLFSAVGFSTLSLSQAQIEQTGNELLSGKQWVLTLVQDGSGGSLQGTITPAQVAVKTGSATIAQPFTMKIDMTKNEVNYPVYAVEGEKIYIVAFYDIGCVGCNRQTALTTCISQVGGAYDVVNPPALLGDWICLQRFETGTFGKAGTGNLLFESRASLSIANAYPDVGVINNLDITNTPIGTYANLKWVGNLVTGQGIPDPANSDVCLINYKQTGSWQTISCTNYITYKSRYENYASCLYAKYQSGDATGANECKNGINDAERLTREFKTFAVSGGTAASTIGTLSSGQLSLPLPKLFQFPVFVLRIKADTIGIVIPSGIPKIISVSSDKFSTGSTGIIRADVQNIGNSFGSFDVSATCATPFSSGDRTRIAVNPQETASAYLQVYGQTAGNVTGLCSVTAIDSNSGTRDTTNVTVSAGVVADCREGTHQVAGKILQKCQGGKWITIKTCSETQVIDATTLECVENKTPGSGGGLGFNFDLFGGLASLGFWIVVVLVLILMIFIFKR